MERAQGRWNHYKSHLPELPNLYWALKIPNEHLQANLEDILERGHLERGQSACYHYQGNTRCPF